MLLLLPPLLYRTLVVKGMPNALIPTIMIFAAPTNVCLNAYLKAFPQPDQTIFWLLFGLAMVLYIGCLSFLPRILLLKKFYPAYSSLTFPLAISGIATTAMYRYFNGIGNDMPILQYLGWFQTAMAVVFVLYVLIRYIHNHLFKPWAIPQAKAAVPKP